MRFCVRVLYAVYTHKSGSVQLVCGGGVRSLHTEQHAQQCTTPTNARTNAVRALTLSTVQSAPTM